MSAKNPSKITIDLADSFERIPVKIYATPAEGALWTANQIASLIKEKAASGKKCVIGFATGSPDSETG